MVYDHSRRPKPQNNSTNFDLTPSPNARKVRPHPQIEQRQEIEKQRKELGITPVEPSRVTQVSPEKYKMSPEMHQETIRPGGVNEELMPLQARIDFLKANPDQNLSLNKISAAKAGPQTQTPQRIAQATPGQSADPVAQFQQDLNRNALTRIQNNRDRLNQSELRYRETDPKKNPNWANLDAQAEIVEDLRHREQNAKDALKGVYDKAIGRGGVPMVPAAFKDIDSNPEESRELILRFYQQVTGPNWKTLEPQFTRYANALYLATKIKHAMYETEPALAVVSAEYMDQVKPDNPQNTRKIQQVMTEGFAPMRDSMGKLEQAIRGDKSGNTAFELDRVVEGTLADIKDPQQRQKVATWIADKRKREQDQRLLGNVLTGLSVLGGAGAGLLGFARTAWVLGGTASALFGATTLQDLRQTGLVLDGAQGQGPGNKSLTSAGVNQAQTAYYSNYVNVAFLLVEGGMTVKSVVGLLQERRALETLAKLTPVERGEFAQAAQLQQAGKTAEAEGRLQKIRKQIGEEAYKEVERAWLNVSGARYLEVDGSLTPKLLRQYEKLANLTDQEIGQIVKNTGIPRKYINRTKEHLFIDEHEIWVHNQKAGQLELRRGNFTPDDRVAKLWLDARNGTLKGESLEQFKRLIAHEYVEQGLMKAGMPYLSRESWRYDRGFQGSSDHYGAHDLAPSTNPKKSPFFNWDTGLGKSSKGLNLEDDLTNLDPLLQEIIRREKLK
jgi:hypothetical protein